MVSHRLRGCSQGIQTWYTALGGYGRDRQKLSGGVYVPRKMPEADKAAPGSQNGFDNSYVPCTTPLHPRYLSPMYLAC